MNACIKLGCLIGFACAMATPAFAGEEKVVLMLGGKFCDGYVGDVEHALWRVPGVKTVDFKSMKGESWDCTGEVMK